MVDNQFFLKLEIQLTNNLYKCNKNKLILGKDQESLNSKNQTLRHPDDHPWAIPDAKNLTDKSNKAISEQTIHPEINLKKSTDRQLMEATQGESKSTLL